MEELNNNEPRFLDPIQEQQENQWERLVGLAQRLGESAINLSAINRLIEVPDVPQVFVDRAHLSSVGTYNVRRLLGVGTSYRQKDLQEFFGQRVEREELINVDRSMDSPIYRQWVQDAFEWQQENDYELLDGFSYIRNFCEMFVGGYIDEEQFDNYLDHIDIRGVMPKREVMANGDDYPLDWNRFPLLEDLIFQPNISLTKDLGTWATEKYKLWVRSRLDRDIEVPSWLDNVDEFPGAMLAKKFYTKRKNRLSEPDAEFSWSDFKLAVDATDWKWFAQPWYITPTLKDIPDEDVQKSLVNYALEINPQHKDGRRVFLNLEDAESVSHLVDPALLPQYEEQKRLTIKAQEKLEESERRMREEWAARDRLAEKNRKEKPDYRQTMRLIGQLEDLIDEIKTKDKIGSTLV